MQNEDRSNLDADFWNNRYSNNETGWDLNQISPPLKAYIDQLQNKNLRILIAGCGNAYEAEYLYNKGFRSITLIDIAPLLIAKLKQKFKHSNIEIIEGDIFKHNGQYDLILEQTLFCAIDPSLREKYVEKMYYLLSDGGKLAGVFFNNIFEKEGPPFGGKKAEYLKLFSPFFVMKTLEPCYNSIAPRQGNELFFIFTK